MSNPCDYISEQISLSAHETKLLISYSSFNFEKVLTQSKGDILISTYTPPSGDSIRRVLVSMGVRPMKPKRKLSLFCDYEANFKLSYYLGELKRSLDEYFETSIYLCTRNHSKLVVSDDLVYIGSANFGESTSTRIEAGVTLSIEECSNLREKIYDTFRPISINLDSLRGDRLLTKNFLSSCSEVISCVDSLVSEMENRLLTPDEINKIRDKFTDILFTIRLVEPRFLTNFFNIEHLDFYLKTSFMPVKKVHREYLNYIESKSEELRYELHNLTMDDLERRIPFILEETEKYNEKLEVDMGVAEYNLTETFNIIASTCTLFKKLESKRYK